MVAAIDWCSHTTHDWISLVSCFGFHGPLLTEEIVELSYEHRCKVLTIKHRR